VVHAADTPTGRPVVEPWLDLVPGLAADGTAAARRLVLVPVGHFDLRATRPLEYSWRIPAGDRRALHVATDERALWELADAWMASQAFHQLHTVENDGGVGRTVAKVVEYELASGFDQVVVLAGRLLPRGRWHRLLHDGTAEAIGRAVAPLPGALAALMTIAVDP
jgi:hypothetical protein